MESAQWLVVAFFATMAGCVAVLVSSPDRRLPWAPTLGAALGTAFVAVLIITAILASWPKEAA